MSSISISKLKENPSKALELAADYPVEIESRNKVKGYIIGKDLFDKIFAYVEDQLDIQAAKESDFSEDRDFEEVAREAGL